MNVKHCGDPVLRETREIGSRTRTAQRCRHCDHSTVEVWTRTGALLRWINPIAKVKDEPARLAREAAEAERQFAWTEATGERA